MKKGKFTALFFVICLCAVQIFCLFKPQVEFSENENRNLQTFPELSLKTVFSGQFMKQFDSFTADQFLFRDHWVSLATRELLAIGKRDNQKTYFGKDGYLFAIDTIDNSQFSKNKELLREFLQKIKQEHPDIRSTVMVVPTSSAILTEKLPYGAPVPDEIPLIEEIGVSVDGLATFCNPVPELQAHTILRGQKLRELSRMICRIMKFAQFRILFWEQPIQRPTFLPFLLIPFRHLLFSMLPNPLCR